ncbi:MAG: Asp-tRNA(Asn)/Glu-tRNA(Gln) amidotransferase subunit GatB [Spirochaetota bacterium]|nr:MAG: Asp-tRNA(Asn)/Glu-tRNA(Gln) amidotransferase subunit GatB [Spirochaetota bacterium]
MSFEAVIGLEIHIQLNTQTKTFCSCSTSFGDKPNSHTCPVCLGLPGALPVFNEQALNKGIMAGLALKCEVAEFSIFARKNYFYPDLPKSYQISQYESPLNKGGYVLINDDEGKKRKVGITRAHLEEDAGKLIHDENPKGPSFVDFNRCGVPLLEIVTEPDIRTPDEAYRFLQAIKEMMQYTEVSECNMEKGELRVDVNISMRNFGDQGFGVKQEIKNMNSFANVKRALEYEVKRQTKILRSGQKLIQQTRLFDVSKSATVPMRMKEEAHDYRYFPDPDLVPVTLTHDQIERIQNSLPELPQNKRERLKKQYNLTDYDVEVLCSSHKLANYFEAAANGYKSPKKIANWILSELIRVLNERRIEIDDCKVTPTKLRDLFDLMDSKVISGKIAKAVFDDMVESGQSASEIVEKKGLKQVTDRAEIVKVIVETIEENEKVVRDYRDGKKKVFGFLVGKVMQKTHGKASPKLVNEILREKLES